MKNTALYLAAVVIMAGCSVTVPSATEYTILPSEGSLDRRTSPISQKSMRIAQIRTLSSLSSKNLYYVRGENEIGAYLYSRWSDTPASMIERILFSSLEEKRVFAALLSPGSSAQTALVLESDLGAFYHRFLSDGTSEGFIDITFRLIDTRTRRVLSSRRFQVAAKAPVQDAQGGAKALSEATHLLSEECVQWLIQQQEKQ